MNDIVRGRDKWFIKQKKEWVEILVDWETRNQYEILDGDGRPLGFIAEKAGGFIDAILRTIFKSHRSLAAEVFDRGKAQVLSMRRPFFFLFSSMEVLGPGGRVLGAVERRFGLLYKKYDLHDKTGRVFAHIRSPLWRLWTFPITDANGKEAGVITKKWGGGLREIFTDADMFMVDLSSSRFDEEQKAVVLSAALSVDFDFFEDNTSRGGLLRSGDD